MNLLPPPSPITSIPALPIRPARRIGVPKRSVLSPIHTFGACDRRRGGPLAAPRPQLHTPAHLFFLGRGTCPPQGTRLQSP